MKMMKISKILVLVCLFAAMSCAVAAAEDVTVHIQENEDLGMVVAFYDSFFNKHEVDEASAVIADDYKQHNPSVPDGKKPFVDYFRGFFKENPESKMRIVRCAITGDIVWLHVHATTNAKDKGVAVVDMFRVKDGKIVEHWDVIQNVPDKSANSNTMF